MLRRITLFLLALIIATPTIFAQQTSETPPSPQAAPQRALAPFILDADATCAPTPEEFAPTDIIGVSIDAVPQNGLQDYVATDQLPPLAASVATPMQDALKSAVTCGFYAEQRPRGTFLHCAVKGSGTAPVRLFEWHHTSNCNSFNTQGTMKDVVLAELIDHDGWRKTMIAIAATQSKHLKKLPAGAHFVDGEEGEETPIAAGQHWEVKLKIVQPNLLSATD